MKTGILKTALVAALSANLSACGDDSKSLKSQVGSTQVDTKQLDTKSESELTGEPRTPEEMAVSTYRLKNATQSFVLKKLGHLVWTRFVCKTELIVENETEPAVMTVSFYPVFKVDLTQNKNTQSLVSPEQLCGTPTTTVTPGSLAKNETNQYHLQYGLTKEGRPVLTMTWDAARKTPGELLCRTPEGKVAKAIIKDCELTPVERLTE